MQLLQVDDEICMSLAMEDVGAMTTDAEKATEEQQLDQSDIEQASEQHEGSNSQRRNPQKLKTSERRRVQNRAAQKTYR
jgi:hypothetical protein